MKLLLLLFSGLKYLKFGKLFATGGTMLLSLAVCALSLIHISTPQR